MQRQPPLNSLAPKAMLGAIALALLLTGGALWATPESRPPDSGFAPIRVAHAGGSFQSQTYTNSLQALTASYALGFRFFEIDLSFTADGHLVCLHDWKRNFKQIFGYRPKAPLNLADFEKQVAGHPRFQNCTLASLRGWFLQHPDARLISDTKEANLRALEQLLRDWPGAPQQLIPQIYQPEHFSRARELGYDAIIWTLYRFDGTFGDVLEEVGKFEQPFAVTMPPQVAEGGLALALKAEGITTLVHTINDLQEARRLHSQWGVSEIYSDTLAPTLTLAPP